MTYMKSTEARNCTLKKNLPIVFYQNMFFTEIFQNQMLKVKIWHFLKPCHHSILKDTEVSFEHFPLWAKTLLILYPRT